LSSPIPAPIPDGYEVRELTTIPEFRRIEELCTEIWGDSEILSKDLLIAMRFEGALIAGAFALPARSMGQRAAPMVAFIFGFPTRNASIQHSQAMGVLEAHRSAGLGARLKWFQRSWCLERGITTVRWTFDPLRAPNAKLNIDKLGATVGVFLPNYYGPMTGINAGSPSDRLLPEWELNAPGVLARVARTGQPERATRTGQPARLENLHAPEPLELPLALTDVNGAPTDPNLTLETPEIRVSIPRDFAALSTTDPALALEWRTHSQLVLEHYFAAGYRITGFDAATCAYTLTRSGTRSG
jgi:chorismate synthase